MTNERLVERAQQGDLEAFNRLVLEHQDAIYSLCLRMVRNTDLAEDVTQEAFTNAWRRIDSLRGDNFRSWLFRIASNACLDALRERTRRPVTAIEGDDGELVIDPADPGPSPEGAVLTSELGEALAAALARLPADQRLAITLCDIHGFQYDEIADMTGAALGTVKSRINRGRTALRLWLVTERPDLLPSRLVAEELR